MDQELRMCRERIERYPDEAYHSDRAAVLVARCAQAADEVARTLAAIELKRSQIGPLFIHSTVEFEKRGVDVSIRWAPFEAPKPEHLQSKSLAVEIKPTMGDDFPSVMRQMERLECKVLVVGEYSGRAVSEPDLRRMFAASGFVLLFVRDIEAEIANARGELGA